MQFEQAKNRAKAANKTALEVEKEKDAAEKDMKINQVVVLIRGGHTTVGSRHWEGCWKHELRREGVQVGLPQVREVQRDVFLQR